MMERKKTSPQTAIKNHRVKFWTTGIMMSTGQDFTPKPYSPCPPSASQIRDVFLSLDFVISTGKLPQEQGGPDLKSHLHTQEQNQFPLLATNATVLVLLRNHSSISIYVWILPNFISSNFCGHCKCDRIHKTHPVKSSSIDGLDPHRVNSERKGSKDVESTFLEVTFL